MLKLINKTTKKNKFELVVPTCNEEMRIEQFIKNNSRLFNLIVIDDNSTDQTVDIAINNDCTVYIRNKCREPIDQHGPTEYAVSWYINNISSSNFIFKLDVDEYINKKNIKKILDNIESDVNFIAQRIDWVYGIRCPYVITNHPLSFKPGECIYNINSLHGGLKNKYVKKNIQIEVDHLNIWSLRDQLDKINKYNLIELSEIKKDNFFLIRLLRRYLVPIITLPFRFIYFKNKNLKLFLIILLRYILEFVLSLIYYCESNLMNKYNQKDNFIKYINDDK